MTQSNQQQEEKKCLCHHCPNYQKCLDQLKKTGLHDKEIELIKKCEDLGGDLGYSLIAGYFLMKGVIFPRLVGAKARRK